MCIHVGGLFIENTSPQIWNILTHLISTGIRAISGVFLVKCSRVKLPDLLITCLSQPWPSKTSQGKIYVSVVWRCESNLKIYHRTLTWVFPFSVTSHFHPTTFIWQIKKRWFWRKIVDVWISFPGRQIAKALILHDQEVTRKQWFVSLFSRKII